MKELIKVVSVLHNAMRGSENDLKDTKFDDRPFEMLMHDVRNDNRIHEFESQTPILFS